MNRSEILLAGLAAGGENVTYTPVQVQKLFFLLDREASTALGGPFFHFVPYDYGPFDQAVYAGLDDLARREFALIQNTGRYHAYGLSQAGQNEGLRLSRRCNLRPGNMSRMSRSGLGNSRFNNWSHRFITSIRK